MSPAAGALCASRGLHRRECNRARCAVPADSGAAFRWWIRIAAAGPACGGRGAARQQHASSVSCGPADRRRPARGESGVCRCHATAPVESDRLPRDRHLVMAASAPGGRARAAGCAARFAGGNVAALASGASAVVVGDREHARAACLRAVVLRYVDGRYQAAPFGQNSGDADESNAAQLWSTVYLAIRLRRGRSRVLTTVEFGVQRTLQSTANAGTRECASSPPGM